MSKVSRRRLLTTAGLATLGGMLPAGGGAAGAGGDEARSSKPRQSAPQATAANVQAFAAGHNAFGLDVYGRLRAAGGNLFFSPYSIAQVLTMASAGANGRTAAQMGTVLHSAFPQDRLHPAANALDLALGSRGGSEGGFKLQIANTVWGQRDHAFRPEFLDILAANYGAGLRLLDFKTAPEAARAAINATIAQQTQDKIKDVFPPRSIDETTRLVLANAIYFNAKWLSPFRNWATRDGPFNTAEDGTVIVPMMHQEQTYAYGAGEGYQAVSLPYRGGVSILVLLPDTGRLDVFESAFSAERLKTIAESLAPRLVILALPKFEYRSDSIRLSEPLTAMGMADAFDRRAADFSRMDGTRKLFISNAFHKAMVRVDEDGTEAAAVTAMEAQLTSARIHPTLTLVVDRPFVFVIRDDESGAILFVGRIMNPKG
jgi:serine protease inhibitor